MNKNRFCNKCTACCTAMAVDELGKPERVRCPHLGPRGCRIYSQRPASCREFICGWLRGAGVASDRPDKLGVVLTSYERDGKRTFHISEVIEGEAGSPRVRQLADAAAATGHVDQVVRVRTNGRRQLVVLQTGERFDWEGPA